MVTDRTLRSQTMTSAVLGYNKGVKDTVVETKKALSTLIERFKWLCTKHTECPDSTCLCDRKTNEPCTHRILNPNYTEAEKNLRRV